MHLTDHERDRLLVFLAAEFARRRRERGIELGHPETVALISDEMLEAARAGHSYEQVLAVGREAVSRDDLLEGVPSMVDTVQVEATFPEGTTLVTLTDPFEDA
jgi:urease subunit gamma